MGVCKRNQLIMMITAARPGVVVWDGSWKKKGGISLCFLSACIEEIRRVAARGCLKTGSLGTEENLQKGFGDLVGVYRWNIVGYMS